MTDRIEAIASAQGIGAGSLRRHLFLCADQTTPKCAPVAETVETWRYVKARLKELGLNDPPPPCSTYSAGFMNTKLDLGSVKFIRLPPNLRTISS